MNPEFPPNNPRAELEARLTAFILGELPAHEAAALRQAMDEDSELAALYERLKTASKLVREVAASPLEQTKEPAAPLWLSEERRQKLLAQFKTVTPKEFIPASRPGISGRRLLEIAAVLALLGILAGLLLPSLAKSKSKSLSAVNRLRQMEWNKSYHEADVAPGPAGRSREKTATVSRDGHSVKADLLGPIDLPALPPPANTTIVLPPAEMTAATTTTTLPGYSDTGMEWNAGTGTHQPKTATGRSYIANAEPQDVLPTLQDLFNAGKSFGNSSSVNTAQNSQLYQRSQTLQANDGSLQQYSENGVTRSRTLTFDSGEATASGASGGGGKAGAKLSIKFANPSDISAGLAQLAAKSGQQLSGGAVTSVTNSANAVGDPEWNGFLEHPDQRHSDSNFFVSRGSFVALPSGNKLDVDSIHNQAAILSQNKESNNLQNQGIGSADGSLDKSFEPGNGLPLALPQVESKAKFADITPDIQAENITNAGTFAFDSGATASSPKAVAGSDYANPPGLVPGSATAEPSKGQQNVGLTGITSIHGEKLKLSAATPNQADRGIDALTSPEVMTESGRASKPQIVVTNGYFARNGALSKQDQDMLAGTIPSPTMIEQIPTWHTNDVEQRQGKLDPHNHALADNGVASNGWSLSGTKRGFYDDNYDNSGKIDGSVIRQGNVNLALTTPPASAAKSPEPVVRAGEVDFADVPADQLLDVYGRLTGRTVLGASNLPSAQISLQPSTDRTRSEAIHDIEGALASNGIAVVNVGGKFVKAMPVQTAGTLGSPFLTNGFAFDDQKKAEKQSKEEPKVYALNPVGYVNVTVPASSSYASTNGVIDIATDEAVKRQAGRASQFAPPHTLAETATTREKDENATNAVIVSTDPESKKAFVMADADTIQGVTNAIIQIDRNRASGPTNILHYNSIKIEAEAEYGKQEKLLKELKKLTPEELLKRLPTAVPDSILTQLLQDKTAAETELAKLKNDLGDQNPEVLRTKKLLDMYKLEIDSRVKGIIQGLEIQVESRRALIQNLKEPTDTPLPKPAADLPIPQPEVMTGENAFSTFSLNVADVSFKLAAASLEKGQMPDPSTIRSEEFVNAFDYRDPEPAPGAPLGFAWERAQYPFAHNRDLLRFSVKTAAAGREAGRPMNIVLLLDKSGSMERADRVRIIHEALRVLATQLGPQDKLSVVTFARVARLWVDGLPGSQAGEVVDGLDKLTPEGGTNLEEAMRLAYETARRHYLAGGINRVVLLTDGAANLGNVDPASLNQKVEQHRKEGIALDCFGVGWEGYNDDLLEVLSRHGDGRYGFINTPEEAANGFAKQLAGALHVAAADVKVQVEFNPRRVTAYRQIGYAKHQLKKEQFRDNTVDAAEIGAAESGNALYVVEVNPNGEGPLATVRVRYKVPGTEDYPEHEWAVPYTGNALPLEQASAAMRLAGVASAFSESLATSPFAGEVTSDQLLGLMRGVPETYGADERPKKLEWMIRQAKSLTGK